MKDFIPIIILLGLVVITELIPTGTVTVKPIFSYGKFLDWYKNKVGDYNTDGTIPNEGEWIDYYATKILKQ